jgi:hypothetical protein
MPRKKEKGKTGGKDAAEPKKPEQPAPGQPKELNRGELEELRSHLQKKFH